MKSFVFLVLIVFFLNSFVSSDAKRCLGKCLGPEYVWDVRTCSCVLNLNFDVKPCGIDCKEGFKLDSSLGQCRCVPVKPSSCFGTCFNPDYVWDYEQCTCVLLPNEPCNIRCASGFKLEYFQRKCRCVPDFQTSPPIIICDPILCNEGLIFDDILCECVKDVIPSCTNGYIYDKNSCSCQCSNITECRDNFLWDENICDCICPFGEVCKPGFIFDEKVCGCVCDTPMDCAEGFTLDEATCSCACIATEPCNSGNIWDEKTCSCVPDKTPQCGPGYLYDPDLCECYCEVSLLCEHPQVFDRNVCQCVLPKFN